MRKYTTALVIAAALAATIAAVPALYAEGNQTPSGPMMRGGMMGDDNNGSGMMGMMKMMKQMSQMMDHCSNMMNGNRPNEQWRKQSPSQPEKKG
jgi:Spy/CpxP family protein refolding chaperone